MSEIIACPRCQRQLLMPAEHLVKSVQCSACKLQFLAEASNPTVPLTTDPNTDPSTAVAEGSPKATPAVVPAPADAGREYGGRPVRKRQQIKKHSHGRIYAAIGITVAVVLGSIGTILILERSQQQPRPGPLILENPAERREEIAQAFQGQPLAPEQIREEIKPLFETLGQAFRARDRNKMLSHFDVNRLYDEIQPQLPGQFHNNRAQFMQGMRQGMGQALERMAPLIEWAGSDIRQVKLLKPGEAVVIVRHQSPLPGATLRMRWWVTKRRDSWKIYDLEDLDIGMRFSTTVAGLAQQDPGAMQGMATASRELQEAIIALAQKRDADGAEAKLRLSAHVRLPPPLEAMRHFAWGAIRLQRGQPAEALGEFDKANALRPDMPAVDIMKALAFNQQGQWAKALTHVKAYRDLLGDDATVCREDGVALAGLGRFDEACIQYRKALDFDPKDADAFVDLIRALDENDNRQDIGPRFAKLDVPHQNFETCAREAEQRRDARTLEALVAALRGIDAKHPPMLYYAAIAKLLAQERAEARLLLRAALQAEPDARRRQERLQSFLQACVDFDDAAEIYALAPGTETFREMAEILTQRHQTDALEALIERHRQVHPEDAMIPLYEGAALVQNGDYARADKAFALGVAKIGKQAVDLHPVRVSRVLARYHLDKAVSAYREIPEPRETYMQLFYLCRADNGTDIVRELVKLHTVADPRDPLLAQARWWLAIKDGQIDKALAIFRESTPKPGEQENSGASFSFYNDMVDAGKALDAYRGAGDPKVAFDVLAGDLIRLRRLTEARKLLDEHRLRHPDDRKLKEYAAALLFAQRNWPEAAKAYRAVWEAAGPDDRNRFRWRFVQALVKAGQGLAAYDEIELRDEIFHQLARQYRTAKQGAELEALIARHRPHAMNDAQMVDWLAAQAKALLKQPAQAVALAQAAWTKGEANPRLRGIRLEAFVADMADAGFGLDAYRAAPDQSIAFEVLVQHSYQRKNEKELNELVQQHSKSKPTDERLPGWRGRLQLLRGDYAGAIKTLSEALKKARPNQQFVMRFALEQAQVKAGQAVQAYREKGATRQAFLDLASACAQDKDGKQLASLLAEHRRSKPGDKLVEDWDIETKWLQGDYAGVVLAYQARDKKTRGYRQADAMRHYICSLVKLDRADEARREAETAVNQLRMQQHLLVLIPALRGNVKRTVEVAAQLQENGFYAEFCYSDADLGPLLRSDAFRAFRDRFPEPATPLDFDPDLDD